MRWSSWTALVGEDRFNFAAAGEFEVLLDEGETAAVGGDDGEFVFLEAEENAVEDIAAFVGGDRVGSAFEHVLENALLDFEGFGTVALGERGEIFLGEADDAKEGGAGGDGGDLLGVDFEGEFGGGQFADDAEETAGGKRGRSAFDDFGFDGGADAGVEVGGGDDQFAIRGLNQSITQDGERGAGADNVLNSLKAGEERFARDDTFHNQRY